MIIGLFVSLPIGPISVMGIRRVLLRGPIYGVLTGAGAASADAVYCFLAAFGLTFINEFLFEHHFWFNLVGGVFLLMFGTKIFLNQLSQQQVIVADAGQGKEYKRTIFTSFFVVITNPVMIVSFIAIFAALGVNAIGNSIWDVLVLVLGVIAGSLGLWILMSYAVDRIRSRFSIESLNRVNRISGVIVVVFGLVVLFGLAK